VIDIGVVGPANYAGYHHHRHHLAQGGAEPAQLAAGGQGHTPHGGYIEHFADSTAEVADDEDFGVWFVCQGYSCVL